MIATETPKRVPFEPKETVVRESIQNSILETIGETVVVQTPSCIMCGRSGTIGLTRAQVAALERGDAIQDVAPQLGRAVREQFISGTHPECWIF